MATVWLRFPFPLQRLLAADDLRGAQFSLVRSGMNCRVSIPAELDASESEIIEGRGRHVVHIFFVEVETDAVHRLSDFLGQGPNQEVSQAVLASFTEAANAAVSIANAYIDRLRTWSGQFWVSSTFGQTYVSGQIEASEGDGSWVVVPFAHGPVRLRSRSFTPLNRLSSASIVCRIEAEDQVGLAELVLADAKFQAEQQAADWRYCVLLAAIACESKIKSTLSALSGPDQQELVDLLFNHPRDYSMAAAALYDKALHAVCGRSMRLDDKDLFKRLCALITDRNRLAHVNPADVTSSAVYQHLNTADQSFFYLQSLLISNAKDA